MESSLICTRCGHPMAFHPQQYNQGCCTAQQCSCTKFTQSVDPTLVGLKVVAEEEEEEEEEETFGDGVTKP
jgi:hypothetical protein